MPVLKNLRREMFVQAYVRGLKDGISMTQAARLAGYADGPGLRNQAYRLTTKDDVRQRMNELIRPEVRKTRRNLASLLERAREIEEQALADRQNGLALQAVALQAKIMLDAKAPETGDYSGLSTREAVLDRARDELGDEAVAVIERMMRAIEPEPKLIEIETDLENR